MAELKGYRDAYERAVSSLAGRDPERMAMAAGCRAEGRTIRVPYLGTEYVVDCGRGTVRPADAETDADEPSLTSRILILHYLLGATGSPLTGEWISYKELPGGEVYLPAYQGRVTRPFLAAFGQRPDDLPRAAAVLGGQGAALGHVGAVVPAFPRFPVAFVLWRGDEEFPPGGTVLYDRTAPAYLPTEDVAVLSVESVTRLKSCLSRL